MPHFLPRHWLYHYTASAVLKLPVVCLWRWWILIKQEMMDGSDISWTTCKSFTSRSRQITTKTNPQSNLRRAHRKGPIGSDDIVRFKIDPHPASCYCVFWHWTLSRPINVGHRVIRCRLAAGTAQIAILRVLTVTFVYISPQPYCSFINYALNSYQDRIDKAPNK